MNNNLSIFNTDENFDNKDININPNVSLEKEVPKITNENPVNQFGNEPYKMPVMLESENKKITRGALESEIPSISTGVVDAMDYETVASEINKYQEVEQPKQEVKKITPKMPEVIDYRLEELERNYYQDNYEKLRKNIFNLPACIFGGIYFYYRKMYFMGFISVAASFILIFLTKNIISLIILGVIYGFVFNPLYKYFARIDIKLIKEDNNNINLESTCNKKGGTISVLGAIILFIVTSLVFMMLTISMFNKDLIKNLFTPKKDVEQTQIELTANNFLNQIEEFINESNSNTSKYQFLKATNGKDVSCTLIEESTTWQLTTGYKLTKQSTTCREFMDNFYKEKEIETYPKSATLTFDSVGNMQDGSKLTYETYNCIYNISITSFECMKK